MSVLVVYDCMLFFMQAARPQRVRDVFQLVEEKAVTICLSSEIIAEIEDVLNRPKHREKFPALTTEHVTRYLKEITRIAHVVHDVPQVYLLERDPKDSKYINLAVAAKAPYLVTRDNDLLDLMNDSAPKGLEFRDRFPDLNIVDPAGFQAVIRSR